MTVSNDCEYQGLIHKFEWILSCWDLCDLFGQFSQQCMHLGIASLGLANLAAGVHNSRMVPAAQMSTDFFEAVFRQISR